MKNNKISFPKRILCLLIAFFMMISAAPLNFAIADDTQDVTVSLIAEGSTNIYVKVPYGTKLTPPAAPDNIPEGMVSFRGWYEDNSEDPFDFNTNIYYDIELYAKFSDKYLVLFKDGFGNVVDSREASPGSKIFPTNKEIVVPENFKSLKYWYVEGAVDEEGMVDESPYNFETAEVNSDFTLVPKFTDNHYVFFFTQGTYIEPMTVESGQGFIKPEDPVRQGYTFLHWSKQENGTEYDFSTPVEEDLNLYAVWDPEEVKYTVVYWLEKPNIIGDPGTDTENYAYSNQEEKHAEAGTQITLVETDLLPINYARFSHSDSVTVLGNGNTVVNVYFKRIEYTFKFDLHQPDYTMNFNGETYLQNEYSFQAKYEQEIENIWPSAANAIFYDNNANEVGHHMWQSTINNLYPVTKRLTVTTELLPSPNSSSTEVTWIAVYGGNETTVNYWFEELAYQSGERKEYNDKIYVKNEQYSQKFNLNGGFQPKEIQGMETGSLVDLGNREYDIFYNRMKYNIIFNTFGGSTVPTIGNVFYEEQLSNKSVADPTKEGYSFKGWYLESEYKTPFVFTEDNYMPNHDLALFAKWEATACTVNYCDGNNIVESQGVERGGYAVDPAIYNVGTAYAGKGEFLGWYWYVMDGQKLFKFSFDTPINRDETNVYAMWKTDGFSIAYTEGDGHGQVPVDSNTYDLGTKARVKNGENLISNDEDEIFIGWEDITDDNNFYYAENIVEIKGDTVFKAYYGKYEDLITIRYKSSDENMGTVDPEMQRLLPDRGFPNGSTATAELGYKFVNWTNETGDIVGNEMHFIPEKQNGMNVEAIYTANFKPVDTEYIIVYYDYDTDEPLADELQPQVSTGSGIYGQAVTVEGEDIDGYNKIGSNKQTIILGLEKSVIKFYYSKYPVENTNYVNIKWLYEKSYDTSKDEGDFEEIQPAITLEELDRGYEEYVKLGDTSGYTYYNCVRKVKNNSTNTTIPVTTGSAVSGSAVTGTGIKVETTVYYKLYYTMDKKGTPTPPGGGPSTSKPGKSTKITEPEVPLGMLEKSDHFAYIIGYPEGDIRPLNNITREEVAEIFYRLLTEESRSSLLSDSNPFYDIEPERWSNRAISTLCKAGILEGYEDGSFKPSQSISRAEFAAIASRFDNLQSDMSSKFTDISGHWAEEYIISAEKKGWINGYEDNTFKPEQKITRAESMTFINNVLGRNVIKENIHKDAKIWPDNPANAWYYEAVTEATNSHNYIINEKDGELWTDIKTNKIWP